MKGQFWIDEFTNASGTISYRVKGMLNGRQVRQNFRTKSEATSRKQELEIEASGQTTDVRIAATRLTQAQIAEAESAYTILPDGRSLLWAVKFATDNYQETVRPITVKKAYDLFIADRAAQNLRPDSLRNLGVRVGWLARDHGDKALSTITTDTLRALIFAGNSAPVTRDNNRRAISAFFNWAISHGYAKENPAAKIGAIKFERDEPELMPLADVKALLSAARLYKDGVCFPYVALGLFAALRPKEIERIGWADIDLEAKTVTLGARVAKMRERRIVELSDNLVTMLKPYAGKQIKAQNWRRDFDAVKTQAGYNGREQTTDGEKRTLKPWPQDIMRHTAISMHLAKHQHEGKTATWAGNSPDIIQRHYKGLVKAKDAQEFWALA
jgi:integrase